MDRYLNTVMFVSRNKDNKNIEGFKQRSMNFVSTKHPEELSGKFQEFVERGVEGEFSRFYISVNARDPEKVHKHLMHFLIDHPDYPLDKMESKIASLADRTDCALTKKWLFDLDDMNMVEAYEFASDVIKAGEFESMESMEIRRTVSGYSLVVPRGFDTREVLSKYEDVSLKRDAMILVSTKKNK